MKLTEQIKKQKRWDSLPIGWVEPYKEKGKLKWDVKLDKERGMFCNTQQEAETLALLALIMNKLKIKFPMLKYRRQY